MAASAVWLAFALRPPEATPLAECRAAAETTDPIQPWRFRTDPRDAGLKGQWSDPNLDDGGWDLSAPGKAWEEQGYADYDGAAWYRGIYAPPSEWGQVYLGLSQVDDDAMLWVNGVQLDWHPAPQAGSSTSGAASQIVQLPAANPLHIALRILDRGGPGGVKAPVRLGRQPWAVLSPDAYARWLAALHPDWPMPGWTRDQYTAWTFTGAPDSADEALMAADASVAPWAAAPTVSLWLYDTASQTLSLPQPKLSLLDDSLPIPRAEWSAFGLTATPTLFSEADGSGVRWLVNVHNDSPEARTATLLAVVRPVAINPDLRPTYAAGFDWSGRLWLDGQPFLAASARAAEAGVGTLAEVLASAAHGGTPATKSIRCAPDGDTAAIMAFPINLKPGADLSLAFAFPPREGAPLPAAGAAGRLEQVRQSWQVALGEPVVVVPDRAVMNGYRASLGYLLIALDEGGPRPGPLAHDALWVRDAAYVGEALLGAGELERVQAYLPSLLAYQEPDGRIPAIIGPDGPEPVEEWDAQGQAIFLTVRVYRYNHDLDYLRRWYPNVKSAAEFVRATRAQTQADPPTTRGLLPPSKSAEDLGPADWHHYWDDFWAVAGLEEAAYAARELGYSDDAGWMQAEADALRQAIRDSVAAVMGADAAYIPGAPEDLTSSAMARGTSVSLFPVDVFSPDDPLIMRSFDYYYARWIAPEDGGYRHIYGQLWPYGGLGLARDYLRLGRQDIVHQILGWSLNHQTLPGTYAWAEQVSPETGGFSGGDMPHAWAAAAYIALIREMLVMRQGESLELFAGVPESWLEAGKVVGVRNAPTEFGTLTVEVSSDLKVSEATWAGTLTLTIEGTARPPDGFRWKLPLTPSSFDGPPGTEIQAGWLTVPRAGGTVRLRYAEHPN